MRADYTYQCRSRMGWQFPLILQTRDHCLEMGSRKMVQLVRLNWPIIFVQITSPITHADSVRFF